MEKEKEGAPLGLDELAAQLEAEKKGSSSKDAKIAEMRGKIKALEEKLPAIESEKGELENRASEEKEKLAAYLSELKDEKARVGIQKTAIKKAKEGALSLDLALALVDSATDEAEAGARLELLGKEIDQFTAAGVVIGRGHRKLYADDNVPDDKLSFASLKNFSREELSRIPRAVLDKLTKEGFRP